jgi:eukaryotic-like serine/threonine-protein kinase
MVIDTPANRISNRYVLHDLLGQGGMGSVYRATDRLYGREVALKRVLTNVRELHIEDSTQAADFRIALAREFKLSASLRHPNIVTVLDYGFDDEQQPYFTMELLSNPQNIMQAAVNLTISERMGYLMQMLYALTYLHRRGIVHRDLKPANVMVEDGTVKVLDFGLSIMHERTQDSAEDMTAGTLAYMAPEVLTGTAGSITADLYAVGMMGYEIIAGKHPFNLDEPALLINQILMEMPQVDELDINSELANIFIRLLQKDPTDRFQTAQEVIDRLNQASAAPNLPETRAIRESFLQAARFVGRDEELEQLTQSLNKTVAGESDGWLLAGESGVGKTRIIDELRTMAMVKGAHVVRGQAVEVGSRPFQMWQMALRWLCLLDENLSDDEIALLKNFISDMETLIGRDVSKVEAKSIKPDEMQSQMINLLERVLRKQNRPFVILFEDLQWAGSESLTALAQFSNSMNGLPVLLIGSYRDDEQPDLYKQLPKMHMLKLRRLDESSIAELSAAMLGDAGRTPQVVDLLQRETEGNVFFVVEVVRALAEVVGNLEQIGRTTLPAQIFAGGIQSAVRRRLNRLDEASQKLLQYAAVMGRDFDIELLKLLDTHIDIENWLVNCINAAVLEVEDDVCRFAHDKLRVGIMELASEERRKELHRHIAETIETKYGETDSTHYSALAHHWGSAGDNVKAERYVTLTGEQALRTGGYHEAIDYFHRAQQLVSSLELSSEQKRRKIAHLRQRTAEANLGFGDYETARSLYGETLTIMQELGDKVGVAAATGNLGEVAFVLDEFDTAQELYNKSLELYREADNKPGIVRTLSRLGDVAYEMGNQNEAKKLYQDSLNLSREIGGDWAMAGSVRIQTSETAKVSTSSSLDMLKGLLRVQRRRENTEELFQTLLRLARAYHDDEDYPRALELAAFLIYCQNSPEDIQDEADDLVLRLETAINPNDREKAWETGKNKSLEKTLDDTLA